ncbi:MAG: FAD binding domain-containing protein [Gemmatimonadota bacterium]|jgi:4-hydroxybenzoyl-CoA reductase subunit beta|nr:4-hydroxybenzoyl-CoA reductase subunit beta [Gemmatimonadota bacterium]MDP6460699.1 FAD binding domain-containing protein [Gemmatimonadota bacterium]MDP6528679.1 FAD binding domain-containing protein [Gemmatimonadota bacterium]MDP6803660.1 FAD binding domain-containing protein [Gemmatimonadota bacterium]MDP7031694.1 FAD binding domain-containing protein [Gemmatimonadota bacterium]
MILPAFRLHRPATVDEAVRLAHDLGPGADFLGGGTDLLQNYKNRLNAKPHVIALDAVEELRGVCGGRIGAMERLSSLERDPGLRRSVPALAEAAAKVASPVIRHAATIGGNLLADHRCFWFNQTLEWRRAGTPCMKAEGDECLVVPGTETCYAAYSGDLAPLLMVLGASLEIASASGRRTVPLSDFFQGDGISGNVLRTGELLTAVLIPEEAAGLRAGYRKLRPREAMDYPEMGVAAAVRFGSHGALREFRVATTALDVVPQFVDYSAETKGRPLAEVLDDVAGKVQAGANPRRNTTMPVAYRKRMAGVYLRRLLEDLARGSV